MDKQEYRTKIDEVRKLIQDGDKEEAFYLLDGMNWRKMHNVNALLTASDIYEKDGRYERARELLEMAHERSPIGRMIIYRLALLCIRLEAYEEAKEYYDEFVEIAPHDSLQYIIQYQLAKARGAEDITLISILEELKEHDFLEEWAYELAYLYHKNGQVEKCISTCDEIILWYGEGPYVERALELKMVYQPLDESQENKFKDFASKRKDGITEIHPGDEFGGNGEILSAPIEIPEVAISNDRFNTQNLQAEIKRNIEEIMQATEAGAVSENMETIKGLVEDIPYAKVPKEATGPLEELSIKKKQGRRIDDTLKTHFKEYLQEEYDGQMSLTIPDKSEMEPQIAGQMTIDQIMSDWKKTARAAEQALSEADEQRLENAKAEAIEEANQIIARLEAAKRELDAGVEPRDLLRNEYLADIPSQSEALAERFKNLKKQLGAAEADKDKDKDTDKGKQPPVGSPGGKEIPQPYVQDTTFLPAGARATAETIRTLEEQGPEEAVRRYATKRIDRSDKREKEALNKQSTFKIPKVAPDTGKIEGVGFEVPIVEPEPAGEETIDSEEKARRISRDATRIVADVNDMLQKEIDRAKGETGRMPSLAETSHTGEASGESSGTFDPNQLPTEQTQAFAEAVVRLLNEKQADEDRFMDEDSFDDTERLPMIQLIEVETGGEEEPVEEEINLEEKIRRQTDMGELSSAAATEIDVSHISSKEGSSSKSGGDDPSGTADRPTAPLPELYSSPAAGDVTVVIPEQLRRKPDMAEPSSTAASENNADHIATESESASKDGGDDPYDTAVLPVITVQDPAEAGQTVQEEESVQADGGLAEAMAAGARVAQAVTAGTVQEDHFEETRPEPDEEPVPEEDEEPVAYDYSESPAVFDEMEDEVPYGDLSDDPDGDPTMGGALKTELTDEEREMFTYFTPISGMEVTLCQVLNGARARLLSDDRVADGNIIIQGGAGSGKTTLATSLISVLRKETGKPSGNVGKLDGERLNTKNLAQLFDKIRGGCLIIERAGDITRETALELSAQMEQDKSGVLVILEDERIGIERVMALNPVFSRRFTGKVVIPILTIDELVNFGKAYAAEMGYSIDEMGVLAMYDRINLIQRTDHPTNLTEVKSIVDEAIDIAEGGGFRGFLGRFGGRHYDADGNLILQEKDFQGK